MLLVEYYYYCYYDAPSLQDQQLEMTLPQQSSSCLPAVSARFAGALQCNNHIGALPLQGTRTQVARCVVSTLHVHFIARRAAAHPLFPSRWLSGISPTQLTPHIHPGRSAMWVEVAR